jgi:DNA repair protein RadC
MDRSARLRTALDALLVAQRFTLAEVRANLAHETPAFLTRLVRQLVREGHLSEESAEAYCWAGDPQAFPAQAWLQGKLSAVPMTQTPAADRPRERLLALGAPALRTAELLAILIRSGRTGESALQAGEKIAARYALQLERLSEAGRGDLKEVTAAVGDTAYCQIMAGIELGRRVEQARTGRPERTRRITDSEVAVAFCREHFARLAEDATQEEFHVVCLDARYQVMGAHRVSVGSLDRSLVHPREVFRPAIKEAAKAVLLVHNHPSGDPTPSDDDLLLTDRLGEAGRTVGIEVLDHVVVARQTATSIREYLESRRAPKAKA